MGKFYKIFTKKNVFIVDDIVVCSILGIILDLMLNIGLTAGGIVNVFG